MSAALPPGWEGILDSGEQILWQGQPSAAVVFGVRELFESVFGLFFTGFAIFWMSMAASMGTPRSAPGNFDFAPLFGLPFLAVGLYMVAGKFFWRSFRRRHTNYTLTNRHGFIATDVFGNRKLRSYRIGDGLELEQTVKGDNLWFATERVTSRGRHGTRSYRRKIGFELIEDGRAVMGLARTALKEPT